MFTVVDVQKEIYICYYLLFLSCIYKIIIHSGLSIYKLFTIC